MAEAVTERESADMTLWRRTRAHGCLGCGYDHDLCVCVEDRQTFAESSSTDDTGSES